MGSPTSLCAWLLPLTVSVCWSLQVEIVEPIRAAGDDVALIFIPGAKLTGGQYKRTAQAIQVASKLRVWAALTGGYFHDVPTPIQIPGAIDAAVRDLRQAGMSSEVFVGVGHSLGGVFLQSWGKDPKFKAVVLMAAYLDRNLTSLRSYPVPVLTLAAELDGQTRISRMVEEYAKLQRDVRVSRDAVYRTPVVCLRGANHGQFASGAMPPRVQQMNPQPEVSLAQVHASVGKVISNFLTGFLSSDLALVPAAHREMERYFAESGKVFQPLLDVKALHESGNSGPCPWASVAQSHLAGDLSDRIQVQTVSLGRLVFIASRPRIVQVRNTTVIHTVALVDKPRAAIDVPSLAQSPQTVSLKLKTKPAIMEARGMNPGPDEPKPSCLALNELALKVALDKATRKSRNRYLARGRPIVFEEDIVTSHGLRWMATMPRLWEDEAGLHVQAVAMTTLTLVGSVPWNPVRSDSVYCKLVTPYRALEWVLVDSLRPY
ncbi:hypothetical protein EGW08_017778 [Elysia chlorotica]|uniref:Alpha/beta hydrolase fold-5 domain-containing protein n=1 Tax=Elysia chlorotica TaxID=188477 RepID=A0A3S1H8V5_ELYCH|nr:hypothetical protein EGW08_017778 [Elysia chlorotica]